MFNEKLKILQFVLLILQVIYALPESHGNVDEPTSTNHATRIILNIQKIVNGMNIRLMSGLDFFIRSTNSL